MKYRELLNEGISSLEKADVIDAKVDAWYLLEHITGMNRQDYILRMNDETSHEELISYREVVAKRTTHYPLQYITGVQEFMGIQFNVNENVLIPRQDTETLVEHALERMHEGDSILDMCTGSGCILISLLSMKKGCTGVGVDLSGGALEVAKQNAAHNGVEAIWLQSDLFTDIRDTFDVIVSNPPYIETAVIDELMPEVVKHEPYMALDGHADGLYFYKKICNEAPMHLKAGGYLLFEIGYDQGESVPALMKKSGFTDIQVIKDYSGNDRVVVGQLCDEIDNQEEGYV